MANNEVLSRRLAITKAQAQMVIVVSVASFITIFCLVAAKAVWSQNAYQSRVTAAKNKAHQQLQKNIQAYNGLSSSYDSFVNSTQNVIGGSLSGTGGNDGANDKIILDALPPIYDFPALTSSIEKVLAAQGLKVGSISGTDDQLNQQSNTSSSNPTPVNMPFSFTISNANYSSVGQLIIAL